MAEKDIKIATIETDGLGYYYLLIDGKTIDVKYFTGMYDVVQYYRSYVSSIPNLYVNSHVKTRG